MHKKSVVEVAALALEYLRSKANADGYGDIRHHDLESAVDADVSAVCRAIRRLRKSGRLTECSYSEGRLAYKVSLDGRVA